jgi:SSS family solute:Na+ symporter
LLIPFFSIASGVAAFYLFQSELPNRSVAPDTAFTELIVLVIRPLGFGLIGVISAGAVGAILSSIDSMMNSAATIVSMDLYRRYLNPQASDAQMIRVGRWSILGFVSLASLFALFVIDPNSEKNFFLQIVDYQGYLTPGLLVVFLLGLFWRRTTPTAAFVTIFLGVFYSWVVEWIYLAHLAHLPGVASLTGEVLNFFHRVLVVVVLCTLTAVLVSRLGSCPEEKAKLTWSGVLNVSTEAVRNLLLGLAVWFGVLVALAAAVAGGRLAPESAAVLASVLTLGMFWMLLRRRARSRGPMSLVSWAVREDRFWAGCLCAAAVFFLFYFY